MPAYGTYSRYGTVPAAPNPIVPANPIHEHPDAFRPDFMPLRDTSGLDASDPTLMVQWDEYAPQGPYELGWFGAAIAEMGGVDRNRDTQPNADRPADADTWPTHFADTFRDDFQVFNLETEYDYDDLDRPGGFTVERRGSDIAPSERAWQTGRNWLPGANSLPPNNMVYDRWRHDELIPLEDFGEPIQPGTDVIVTVDRKMVQGQAGNLAEGMLHFPHPAGDNILQAPMAPSQFPDRAMEIPDPYLPGGGIYSDKARAVYLDPATDLNTQAFAEPIPAGPAGYDQVWE